MVKRKKEEKSIEIKAEGASLQDMLANVGSNSSEWNNLPKRSDTRRKWTEKISLDPEDIEVIAHFFEVLNITPINDLTFPLAPHQIDQLADELMTIRGIQDMCSGRHDTLRNFIFGTINAELDYHGKDPDKESGAIEVPSLGIKLSKEVSGGKPQIDMGKLKEILSEQQFHDVTNIVTVLTSIAYPDGKELRTNNTSTVLNEDALKKQLQIGNIGMEQIMEATEEGSRKTSFYVRSYELEAE